MSDSFLGSGRVFIDRLSDAGVPTGLKIAGACTKFEINTESELKEQLSKGRDDYGQVLTSVTLPGKSNISLTLNQLDADNLAMAFLGSKTQDNQASGTVTSEAVTAHLGYYSDLAFESVSAVVVKDETDTTTYNVDDDYTVDTRLGMIYAVDGGAISEGDVLHISYDYAAVTKEKIVGADSPILRASLILDGKNMVNGRNVRVIVPLARLKPSTAVDFLSDDFLPLELEGLCEIPDGGVSFEIQYLAAE